MAMTLAQRVWEWEWEWGVLPLLPLLPLALGPGVPRVLLVVVVSERGPGTRRWTKAGSKR